jgi:DNA (cytosine-5)-methyltransferase 1
MHNRSNSRRKPGTVRPGSDWGIPLKIVALFAGIAGIELGLSRAGHSVTAFAETDPCASLVLARRFPNAANLGDVSSIKALPTCDILTAGFPCQDLSQAGGTAGIHGVKSRLVGRAFEAIERSRRKPGWLLLENVPFMLSLHEGAGMLWLSRRLEKLGYAWAYRTIDARAFGLAQRRRRLFILASRVADPGVVLFAAPGTPREPPITTDTPHGFYWTEGNRGVGWAPNAIPPLKSNSGLGIISPPAVWIPTTRSIVTPTIDDAEALQGFPRGWTRSALELPKGSRTRWRLVGNAVSVPIAEWIGRQLAKDQKGERFEGMKMPARHPWPRAGFGGNGQRYLASVSEWPGRIRQRGILDFLSSDAPPLSVRATTGFLSRLLKSNLRVPQEFIEDLSFHIADRRRHADDRPRDKYENVAHARAG